MDLPLWLKLLIATPGFYLIYRFLRWLGEGRGPGTGGDGGGFFCDDGGDGGGGGDGGC